MKNRNWFWGIFLILAGVALVVGQFFTPGNINLWTAIASVLLLAVIVQSIVNLKIWGIIVPCALIYLLYQTPLALPYVSPWLLIFSSVLASCGLAMLFPGRRHHAPPPQMVYSSYTANGVTPPPAAATENADDNHPAVNVNFGAASKYLHSTCLESGQFNNSFGALEVFFDQAQLSPNGATVYLDCNFGAIKLYIPRHWAVKNEIRATLGGVSDGHRVTAPAEGAPVLTLTGNVTFGGIEICYV